MVFCGSREKGATWPIFWNRCAAHVRKDISCVLLCDSLLTCCVVNFKSVGRPRVGNQSSGVKNLSVFYRCVGRRSLYCSRHVKLLC